MCERERACVSLHTCVVVGECVRQCEFGMRRRKRGMNRDTECEWWDGVREEAKERESVCVIEKARESFCVYMCI